MDRIKFSVIGAGRIGERHAQHILEKGLLTGICDIKKDRADQMGKEYDVPCYYDINDLLAGNDCDVVSVCTPNGLHARHTIQALRAGKHVLCEKPMATSVQDAGQMIYEAEKANRRLFIVKQNRFNPPVIAVKNVLDEGHLGRINSIQLNCFWNRNQHYYQSSDWKGTRDMDGGTLFTQFSHFIDLLYWIVGDVKDVMTYADNFLHRDYIEFEDAGVVILKFYNGAIGTINYNVNSHGRNMEGSLTLFCEKGTVKIGGQYLNELEYQDIENFRIEGLPEGNPPNYYGQYVGSMSNHDKVYDNVIEVLQNSGVIATSGYEGLKTVEIIERIYNKL